VKAVALVASLALAGLVLVPSAPASAQEAARTRGERTGRFTTPAYGTEWSTIPQYTPSSENFTLELRIGTYQPDVGASFSAFRGDLGPMIGLELDIHAVRIPYIGPLAFGIALGWGEWTGPASATGSTADVGETGLSLVPLTALAVLRIDGLARYANIPFIISPKLGLDVGFWQTGTSAGTQADGWSVGVRWAVQVALELDFLDPRAARRLDNAWGINHSALFVELYGSTMGSFSGSMLTVGTPITWAAGLGFTF
jgi:hypothetical protein